MQITLTISGDTAAEIKNAVSELSNSFTVSNHPTANAAATAPPVIQEPEVAAPKTRKPTSKKAEAPVEETPAAIAIAAEEAPTEETPPLYTLARIREATGEKIEAGKKDAVAAILKELGVKKVPDIPVVDYETYMEKLKAIK